MFNKIQEHASCLEKHTYSIGLTTPDYSTTTKHSTFCPQNPKDHSVYLNDKNQEFLQFLKNDFKSVFNTIINLELELNKLLDLNQSILSYDRYEYFTNTNYISYGNITENYDRTPCIKKSSSTECSETKIEEDYHSKWEEGKYTSVQNEFLSIWNVIGFWSTDNHPVDILLKYPNSENPETDLFMYNFGKLNQLTNFVLDNMRCAFAHYTSTHFVLMRSIISIYLDNLDDKTINQNYFIKCVSKFSYYYYETSLKMLAIVYNKKYQATGWMVKAVLFLQELKTQFENPMSLILSADVLQSMAKRISELVSLMELAPCDFPDDPSRVIIPITESFNKMDMPFLSSPENHPFGKPFFSLQLNEIYWKLSSSAEPSDKMLVHLSKVYQNLMLVTYLLDLNGFKIPSTNYGRFNPFRWLAGYKELDETAISIFRRNATERDENDERWERMTKKFFRTRPLESAHAPVGFAERVRFHNGVLCMAQTVMVRHALTFLVYCYDLWLAIEPKRHSDATSEFHAHCTGVADPFAELTHRTGLAGDALLGPMAERMSGATTDAEKFVDAYRTGLAVLFKCAHVLRVETPLEPVIPLWNAKLWDVFRWPFGLNPSVAGNAYGWIDKAGRAAVDFVASFERNFEHIDFHTFNYMWMSINNQRLYASDFA